jgi:hypothetical protein
MKTIKATKQAYKVGDTATLNVNGVQHGYKVVAKRPVTSELCEYDLKFIWRE